MLSLLASLYLENNNLDSAYRVYDKLTQLEPDNANLYFNRAKIFYEWKSYDDALQEIASSLRLEPDNEERIGYCKSLTMLCQSMAKRRKVKQKLPYINGIS
jgi:tetratricopeptide (TPR) repeat protein